MRIKKLWMTIVLICCGMLLFAACKEERVAQSIALNEYSAETPLELGMGAFLYGKYTVTVTYDNGETETVALTEDMISEVDKLKFYYEGKNEITITYKGVSTPVSINVVRNEFSDNVQLNDVTKTYTGEAFTVEVEGDIPGGTKILYPQGNVFQNAGTYDMTAVLQCDGYVTKTLSARVVIEKATYDVSNAQLYDDTFVYDTETHGLAVKGKAFQNENGTVAYAPAVLPEGVSVNYTLIKINDGAGVEIPINKQQVVEGNKAIDAGTYKVCARFQGDASNYEAIPDAVAYLTIERAAYDLSKVKFDDATVTYSGEAYPFGISKDSKVPLDVEVSYQIKYLEDGAGNAVTEEYSDYDPTNSKGFQPTEAGKYLVKAIFTITGKNASNYIADPLEKEAYLTILPAAYEEELTGLYVDSQWYDWEENGTYAVYFEYELPEGVTPTFTLTDENGKVIEGSVEVVITNVEGKENMPKTTYKYVFTVDEAGVYTCEVAFEHNNENYKQIKLTVKAWIFINSIA